MHAVYRFAQNANGSVSKKCAKLTFPTEAFDLASHMCKEAKSRALYQLYGVVVSALPAVVVRFSALARLEPPRVDEHWPLRGVLQARRRLAALRRRRGDVRATGGRAGERSHSAPRRIFDAGFQAQQADAYLLFYRRDEDARAVA